MSLPSPATLYNSVWRGDSERYKSLIEKSRAICESYSALNTTRKKECLREWYRSAFAKNQGLIEEYKNKDVNRGNDYKLLDELGKGDYAKVDLLRMLDKSPTFFFSEKWIRLLYNSPKTGKFEIAVPVGDIPSELKMESESDSGPGPNYMFYSFEHRMEKSQEKFSEWIKTLAVRLNS